MIYTFYSFKGGVGRSMALANLAELLYAKKLNVLMVDFDLEAPGLELYFSDVLPDSAACVMEKPGMIDLLNTYKKLRSLASPRTLREGATLNDRIDALPVPPLEEYIVEVRKKQPGRGSLSLITSGARGRHHSSYAQQVLSFDWGDFYLNHDGELFFEWFRREAERDRDAVLIDSRTGVTEMSGVCTHQLADVVVSFVAANQQNQDGVLRTARSLANPDLIQKGRHGRPLSQILVPSRLEISEGDQAKRFQENFPKLVAQAFPDGVPGQESVSFDLAIPYVPYFAFDERVAAREPNHPFAKLIQEPIGRLASLMAKFAPADKPMYLRHHSSTEHLAKLAETMVESWPPERQEQARALLERMVTAAVGSHGGTFSVRAVPVLEFPKPVAELLPELESAGTLNVEPSQDGQQMISFADPDLPLRWTRLNRWISEDIPFLAWLQRVSAGLREWESTGKSQDLLSGTPLEDARRWIKEKSHVLNEWEQAYVEASQTFDLRQRATQKAKAAEQASSVSQARGSELPLLTPVRNQSGPAAIMFVHGFKGNPTTAGGEFPLLLAADSRLNGWDIFNMKYAPGLVPNAVGLWRPEEPISRLASLFSAACGSFDLAPYSRLAIIAHSVGGLVVQRALLDDPSLTSRVSHLFLFATPSAGLAKAGPFSFLKRQARDLGDRSDFIRSLRGDWSRKFGDKAPFQCCVVAGALDQFVPPSSSLGPFPAEMRFVVPGDHVDIVRPSSGDDPSLRLVVNGITGSTSFGHAASEARAAIDSRQFPRVVDILWPQRAKLDEQNLLDLAVALDQCGRADDAITLLSDRGADHLVPLAGRLKRRWLTERRRPDAELALKLYTRGLELAEGNKDHERALYYGINIAFLQLAYRLDAESAKDMAQRVLVHCQQAPKTIWTLATEGDSFLILGQTPPALSKYQQAADERPEAKQVDSIYREAVRVADLVGDDEAIRALAVIFDQEPIRSELSSGPDGLALA